MGYSDYDKRMKKYEYVSRNYLTTRVPVIIRIDGRSFHTFTNGFHARYHVISVREYSRLRFGLYTVGRDHANLDRL